MPKADPTTGRWSCLMARVLLLTRRLKHTSNSALMRQGINRAPIIESISFLCLALALKYRWLIIAVSGLALAIGFIQTFTSTPIYQATVTIQIDRQAPKLVKEVVQDRDFGGGDQRFYKTQFDLLKSRSLAERVAADLDLADRKGLSQPAIDLGMGKAAQPDFPFCGHCS